MQSKSQNFGGWEVTEHLGSDSGVPPSVTGHVAYVDSVTVLGQITHGDHRTPNEFRYIVRRDDNWKGGNHYQEWVRFDPKPISNTTGCVDGSSLDTPVWDNRAAAYNLALERLNDKVRGGLDLGVDLVEAGQTTRMIKSLDRVFKFARIQRVGHGIADASHALANGWLEWQYGWRPLCQDVFGALDEGLNIIEHRLQNIKARGTIQTDRTSSYAAQINGLNPIPVTERITGKQSCQLEMTLEIPAARADPARWSSLNPISLAWEVIPYSFVVDWFFDVGSYLRNVETALLYGTQFKIGCQSELLVHKSSAEHKSVQMITGGPPFDILHKLRDFKRGLYFVQFERNPLHAYPFPRPPSFKVDLGSERLFSAAALLRQLLKR